MQQEDEWGPKPKQGWHLKKGQEINADDLKTWLQEMSYWAERARRDIKELEKKAGLPPGDPGAPPPPPE